MVLLYSPFASSYLLETERSLVTFEPLRRQRLVCFQPFFRLGCWFDFQSLMHAAVVEYYLNCRVLAKLIINIRYLLYSPV